MKQKLRHIVQDLTSLDPGLKSKQTEELVRLFLKAKPRANMNKRFKQHLRSRLFARTTTMFRERSGFLNWFFVRRLQLAAAATVLSLLLIATVAFLPLLVTFQQKNPVLDGRELMVKQDNDSGEPAGTIERKTTRPPAKTPQPKQTTSKELMITEKTPTIKTVAEDKLQGKENTLGKAEKSRDLAAPSYDELNSTGGLMATEETETLKKEEPHTLRDMPGEPEESTENAFLQTRSLPLSLYSPDGDTSSYAEVRSYLNRGLLPPPDAVRPRELINYFNYDYQQPAGEQPFTVFTEIAECPWSPEHKLLHIGIRSPASARKSLPPANLIFLLDVSGSMNQPGKLPLLKQAIRRLTEHLRTEDRISIIVYEGQAGLALPPSGAAQKDRIFKALDTLHTGRATAENGGLVQAYDLAKELFRAQGNNSVILATDGDLDMLYRFIEQERNRGILFTVLDFNPDRPPNLELGKQGNNADVTYVQIDSSRAAQNALNSELNGTLYTIQSEFNPGRVKAYRLLANENRRLTNGDLTDRTANTDQPEARWAFTVLYEIIPEQPGLQAVSPQILTISVRYQGESVEVAVTDAGTSYMRASANFRLAAAAAEWGLLLTNSRYKGNATYKQVLELVRGATDSDSAARQAEFMHLVQISQDLSGEP